MRVWPGIVKVAHFVLSSEAEIVDQLTNCR